MEGKLINFFRQSQSLVFDAAKELELNDPDICYFVEQNRVEIYLINKEKQKKYFLAEIIENNLIMGLSPNNEFSLVAHVDHGTVLRKASIEDIFKEEAYLEEFSAFFDSWIFALNDKIFPQKNRKLDIYLEDNRSYKNCLDKIISFRGDPRESQKVKWLLLKEGQFLLKNHPEMLYQAEVIFPIISKTWIKSLSQTISFERLSISALLKQHKDPTFVQKIIERLLYNFFCDSNTKLFQENKRLLQRIISENTLVKKTYSLLLSLLWKRKEYRFTSNMPLIVQVFETIANHLDIPLKLPRFFTNVSDFKLTINEIADSSSIKVKRINLEKGWWKKDIGHFIGFKTHNNKPVAVIRRLRKYVYFDTETGELKKISKKNINNFLSVGYYLFKSFPESNLTWKKIFSMGLFDKRKEVVGEVVIGLLIILLNSVLPFAAGLIFNTIIPLLETNLLLQLFVGLIIISISFGIFLFLSGMITLHIQSWLQFILQSALWDKLLKLPISFFSKYTVGNLLRRAFSITLIQNIFNNTFFIYTFTAMFSFIYLISMFYYSFKLALIGIGVVFSGCLMLFLFYKRIIKNDIIKVDRSSEYNGFVLQVINGIEKIRLTALEKIIYSLWGEKYYNYASKDIASKKLRVYASSWNDSLTVLSTLIIFFAGLHYIRNGMPVSNFVGFYVAFGIFSFSIYRGVNILGSSLGTIIPFWKQARTIIDAEEEIKKNLAEPDKLMGYIQVENVSFKYEDSETLILHDISLKIDPGEFVAIVGPSGCGKSTLFRLLFKFYEPTSGTIYFDGNDLSRIDAVKLRKQLGIVLQDSDILAGTIYDNLLVQEGITEVEIDKAMKLSGFDKVINELPMKYFTYLSEGGKNLSGGQKQQLLIARSLLRNPQILFLDEATNALDNKTQNEIAQNIKDLKITRVVIAHRLSTIKSADRIYVMKDGRIIESGSWDELVSQKGFFATLLEKQKI